MKFSKHSIIILVIAILVLGVVFGMQFFYLDAATRQISLQGVGPIFVGRMSNNLQKAMARPFVVHTGSQDVSFEPEQVRNWIEPYLRPFTRQQEYRPDADAIADAIDDFAPGLDTKPINAQFGVSDDGAIFERVPAHNGQQLDIPASVDAIIQALIHDQSSASLVLASVEPELSAATLQTMGITDLLGEGTSDFKGSVSSRVHNIGVASKKFNNILVAPGEEFSFNDRLGDTEAAQGYLPGLVIKNGTLVPEYGGGVCQVSTTVFRAAMKSGLAIIERHPHSIPVRYYNPQGYDATVYQGVVDFRFKNDTQAPILIQSRIEGTKLVFDFFGKPDGRSVAIDGPRQYGAQPDGSLKAVISRTVTFADGTDHKDTFYSNYKSPSLFPTVRNPLE